MSEGNYTKLSNDVLERLISINLSATELECALFIYRKTVGFHKDEDKISFSLIARNINKSRRSVIYAINRLKLVNIIALVKSGKSLKQPTVLTFNKDINSWKLVKGIALVQSMVKTSAMDGKQLVQRIAHTKENITKENIQKKGKLISKNESNEVTSSLETEEGKNSMKEYLNRYKKYYARSKD